MTIEERIAAWKASCEESSSLTEWLYRNDIRVAWLESRLKMAAEALRKISEPKATKYGAGSDPEVARMTLKRMESDE